MALTAIGANAQNLQLHYDFGRPVYSDEEKNRQNVTATFEKFSADDLGSWYYFVDLDLDKDGIMSAYTEVSREFTFAKASETSAFAAHVEFDGGMGRGGSYQSAALVGGAWNDTMQISPPHTPFRQCTSSSSSSLMVWTHTLLFS